MEERRTEAGKDCFYIFGEPQSNGGKELSKKEITHLFHQADVTAVFCSKSCRELIPKMEKLIICSMSEMEKYIKEGQRSISEGDAEYKDHPIDRKKKSDHLKQRRKCFAGRTGT